MNWRLLETQGASAAWNMAVDEALLESHRRGLSGPTVRFYRWKEPTLSLGYAQRLESVDVAACQALGLSLVRRPTGGRAVLHTDDFTYSLVASHLPGGVSASYAHLATALSRALGELGIPLALRGGVAQTGTSPDCFASATAADLCAGGRKLIGSAQVRRGEAVLQHGSLFFRYPFELSARLYGEQQAEQVADLTMLLGRTPGWEEVRQAFERGLASALGGSWEVGALSEWELAWARENMGRYELGFETH